jgi:hypothetical protein
LPSWQKFLEAVNKTNARDAGISHDQRGLDAKFAQIVLQPSQGAEVEPNGGQVRDQRHVVTSPSLLFSKSS